MREKTLLDTTVPNPGRIYDYMLGGHHNFEVDRQVAERIKTMVPFLPKLLRMMRWCLQDVARTLTVERGYRFIVDFASGLPTVDHIHTAVAPGTTVIYSDRDPVCVEYSREILQGVPNTYYFQADCRRPEELLNSPEVQQILGGNRTVAFVYWGISMYMTDEDIAHVARVLYDWSDEKSCWAFFLAVGDREPKDPAVIQVLEMYRKMGDPMYPRPLEVFQELTKPWRADALGYRTLEEWHGVATDDIRAVGWEGYGVYLIK